MLPPRAHASIRQPIWWISCTGRTNEAAKHLIDAASSLDQAGTDIILLECVPNHVTEEIMKVTAVPVVGIGAGPSANGQVLVMHDLLGITCGKSPRFVKTSCLRPVPYKKRLNCSIAR